MFFAGVSADTAGDRARHETTAAASNSPVRFIFAYLSSVAVEHIFPPDVSPIKPDVSPINSKQIRKNNVFGCRKRPETARVPNLTQASAGQESAPARFARIGVVFAPTGRKPRARNLKRRERVNVDERHRHLLHGRDGLPARNAGRARKVRRLLLAAYRHAAHHSGVHDGAAVLLRRHRQGAVSRALPPCRAGRADVGCLHVESGPHVGPPGFPRLYIRLGPQPCAGPRGQRWAGPRNGDGRHDDTDRPADTGLGASAGGNCTAGGDRTGSHDRPAGRCRRGGGGAFATGGRVVGQGVQPIHALRRPD